MANDILPRAVRIGTCFGWHHPRMGDVARLPVVLCAPFGVEALATHLGWRALAQRLAAQGHDVIRFDYAGTGLSPGEWLDDDPVARWRHSVQEAIDAAKACSGVEDVVLIGLRLGATLAAITAQGRSDVAGLIALAPVTSGKRYARELKALAQMQGAAGESPSGLAAYGFELHGALTSGLGTLELATLARPALAGLIATRTETDEEIAAGWGYDTLPFEGFEAFTENPTHSTAPEAVFARVATWCAALAPAERVASAGKLPTARFEAANAHVEEAMTFGPDNRLFGMHYTPAGEAPRLGVLIGNAGRNPAAGWGRQGVELARLLAKAGHDVLLFDLSGVGDSSAPKGESGEMLYSATQQADIRAGVEALRRHGASKVFVIGACSGAYAALHAAQDIEGLSGIALVNLLRFHWAPGESLDVATAQTSFRPTQAYGRRLFQKETWLRLLRGEIAVLPIARTILNRVQRRLQKPVLALADRLGLFSAREREAWRWFRALDARGVQVLMVHGPEDPGVSEVTAYFGPEARDLAPLSRVSWIKIDGGDHSFSRIAGRTALNSLLLETLARLAQGTV